MRETTLESIVEQIKAAETPAKRRAIIDQFNGKALKNLVVANLHKGYRLPPITANQTITGANDLSLLQFFKGAESFFFTTNPAASAKTMFRLVSRMNLEKIAWLNRVVHKVADIGIDLELAQELYPDAFPPAPSAETQILVVAADGEKHVVTVEPDYQLQEVTPDNNALVKVEDEKRVNPPTAQESSSESQAAKSDSPQSVSEKQKENAPAVLTKRQLKRHRRRQRQKEAAALAAQKATKEIESFKVICDQRNQSETTSGS